MFLEMQEKMHSPTKLESKEIYIMDASFSNLQPTSQKHFVELFENSSFDWANTFLLPRVVTMDSRSRVFQYKILHNILYLNKRLKMFYI